MESQNFWDSPEHALLIVSEFKDIKKAIGDSPTYEGLLRDLSELLAAASDDPLLVSQIGGEAADLLSKISKMESATRLSGKFDACNAFLSLQAGAGGTEARAWTAMLFRMYERWAGRKGFKMELIDIEGDDNGGIRSATVRIEGKNAFGLVSAEMGVHRLQRVSPFGGGERQTSFAAVEASPEVKESDIVINRSDIERGTCRGGGPGGQHKNKTETVVILKHIPTGIVVRCESGRSQSLNEELAYDLLRAKLYRLREMKREEAIAQGRKAQHDIRFGNQIRTYSIHPYTLVTDHRTGMKLSDIDGVLDGDIDGLIEANLDERARA